MCVVLDNELDFHLVRELEEMKESNEKLALNKKEFLDKKKKELRNEESCGYEQKNSTSQRHDVFGTEVRRVS